MTITSVLDIFVAWYRRASSGADWGRVVLPAFALILIVAAIVWLRPNAGTYNGMHILLRLSPVIMLAAMAQMFVLAASDVDLGIGPFVALVNAVTVVLLPFDPLLGSAALGLCILAYVGMGAIIHLFELPSIVVTLGASFVWLGLALILLPQPGGAAPEWLVALFRVKPPLLPLPLYIGLACALAGHLLFRVSSYGPILRGFGNNPAVLARAGRSPLIVRLTLYGLAGLFGVLAGLAISGLSTTGDANVGRALTLLSIAAVIIGGGEFFGGIISAAGTIVGALIMLVVGTLLTFLSVEAEWQFSVQGGILLMVLAGRTLMRRWRA